MAGGMSGFRTPEAAGRYCAMYDDLAARHWPVPRAELDVPTRFGPTHVRRSGPEVGTPMVMIHPTSGSSFGWRSLVEPFAERYPVYTQTRSEPGRSIQQEPIRSVDDLCDWLDEVLESLELERVHLCGYSEGGWIAAVHAAGTRRPDRVATLTLIEPAGAIERIPRLFLAEMIIRAMGTLRAKDKRIAIQSFSHWLNGDVELTNDELELVEFVFDNFRQNLPRPQRLSDQALRQVRAPTLLILGAETGLFDPAKVADRARRLLVDVRVDIIPDAGHGVGFQYPERTAARILEFVQQHAPSPSSS